MSILREMLDAKDGSLYESAPHIPFADIRILWHIDYYDGPLKGVASYQDDTYLFAMLEENEANDNPGWYRRFALICFLPEQRLEELHWHDLFRTHVGEHTEYNESNKRNSYALRQPQSHWHLFYDPYNQRVPIDYGSNTVKGWFHNT